MLNVHGKRIKIRRQALNLSIEDVARHCDCSVTDIEQAERAGVVDQSIFQLLCDKLQTSGSLFQVDEQVVVLPTGREFKKLRKSLNISVADIAKALGLSRVLIFDWEKTPERKINSSRIRLAGQLLNQPWGLPQDNG